MFSFFKPKPKLTVLLAKKPRLRFDGPKQIWICTTGEPRASRAAGVDPHAAYQLWAKQQMVRVLWELKHSAP